ncbi:MAG TPA: hypothetical protein VGR28_11725 [Candidatus Thermoplasmatota archaeon]|nr:hypothetical protein [Candidatus Thermoplasmatota archaeon]
MDDAVAKLMKGSVGDILRAEDLVFDAMRDIVRDELKRKIREQLEASPELRDELRDAVRLMFEAKMQEAYAGLKLAKAGAKLGLEMLPPDLRAEIGRELQATFEKEVARLLEKTL